MTDSLLTQGNSREQVTNDTGFSQAKILHENPIPFVTERFVYARKSKLFLLRVEKKASAKKRGC